MEGAVTLERMQAALLGLTTQIEANIQEAKIEVIGLVTEAELRWQAKLDEQLATPDLAALRRGQSLD